MIAARLKQREEIVQNTKEVIILHDKYVGKSFIHLLNFNFILQFILDFTKFS